MRYCIRSDTAVQPMEYITHVGSDGRKLGQPPTRRAYIVIYVLHMFTYYILHMFYICLFNMCMYMYVRMYVCMLLHVQPSPMLLYTVSRSHLSDWMLPCVLYV